MKQFTIYNNQREEVKAPQDELGFGVFPLDFSVSSIGRELITDSDNGQIGITPMGVEDRDREISLKFYVIAKDARDYHLKVGNLYTFLHQLGDFYIARSYEPNKTYHVIVTESYSPERIENNQTRAEIAVSAQIYKLPYAQSLGTTKDIIDNGINVADALWEVGMGLTSEMDADMYDFSLSNGQSKKVINASTVPFPHPFKIDFKVLVSEVTGGSDGFKLSNSSNGNSITYNGSVSSSDEVVYDRMIVQRNGLNALSNSSKDFMSMFLSPGENNIKLEKASAARIAFHMRFYYYR